MTNSAAFSATPNQQRVKIGVQHHRASGSRSPEQVSPGADASSRAGVASGSASTVSPDLQNSGAAKIRIVPKSQYRRDVGPTSTDGSAIDGAARLNPDAQSSAAQGRVVDELVQVQGEFTQALEIERAAAQESLTASQRVQSAQGLRRAGETSGSDAQEMVDALGEYVNFGGTACLQLMSADGRREIYSAILRGAQQAQGAAAQAASGARAQCVRAAHVVHETLKAIAANAYENPVASTAASVVNVAARNALAVFATTAIRQFLSYGLEAAMDQSGASDETRSTLGLLVPIAASGALAVGAMRDEWAKTATPTSRRSRLIMGAGTLGVGLATKFSGSMAGAAPLMLAFTAYTAMRDLLVQSRLRMHTPNTEDTPPDANHYALIGLLYGLDQALVDLGMSYYGSPSGAGAVGAGTDMATMTANTFKRAAMNWAGEVGEDLMFQSIGTHRAGRPLKLQVEDVGYQRHNVVNGALGPFAVRTGILSMTIGMVSMLSHLTRDNEAFANNPDLMNALNAAIIGLTNAVLYQPFAEAGGAQPQLQDYERLATRIVDITDEEQPAETEPVPSTTQPNPAPPNSPV